MQANGTSHPLSDSGDAPLEAVGAGPDGAAAVAGLVASSNHSGHWSW